MHSTTIPGELTDKFLQKLRQSTSAMHEKLETNRLSKNLMKDDVTPNDYTFYLQKMKAVIEFCEVTIFPIVKDIIPRIEERKKLHLIKADLHSFKKDEFENSLPYEPFNQTSIPFALGYFYVIEGSSLGGRVILTHLLQRLHITVEKGCNFFAGYKNDTGAKWKDFLQHFSGYAVTNNCEEEIISGAHDAFDTIYRYFEL